MLKIFSFFILFFCLVACGPIYNTKRIYYPPQDTDGKYCINSCAQIRQNCSSNCKNIEQNCEIAAKAVDVARSNQCLAKKKHCIDHPQAQECVFFKFEDCNIFSTKHNECNSSGCMSECSRNYNECYTNCGGEIKTKTVCVANCK